MARILIVDDNLSTLETVSMVLRRAGFETAIAVTGAEGVALASGGWSNLMLIDLCLPDMSGLDVVRELKRQGVETRKVIVTAFPTEDTAFLAGSSGADGYVDGPLFGDDIVDVVVQALGGPYPVVRGSHRRLYSAIAFDAQCAPREHAVSTSSEIIPLDGYARWVEAILAVVVAAHDVPALEFWPSVLPTARSLAAIRHWCRAVGLPAGGSLDLARGLHALMQGRRTGRDPRKLLKAATRETANRFWRRAGRDDAGRLPETVADLLDRQQFIRDPDALQALRDALRKQFPNFS